MVELACFYDCLLSVNSVAIAIHLNSSCVNLLFNMILINFKKTAKQSFANGVLKGMAAPVMLFGSFTAQKLPQVSKIEIKSNNINQSLASDWYAVCSDINNSVVKYGETKKNQSTK